MSRPPIATFIDDARALGIPVPVTVPTTLRLFLAVETGTPDASQRPDGPVGRHDPVPVSSNRPVTQRRLVETEVCLGLISN